MKQFIEVTCTVDGKNLVNINHIIGIGIDDGKTYINLIDYKRPILISETYEEIKNLISLAL